MSYSFEAIEKQAQAIHQQTESILSSSQNNWKSQAKRVGVVALSAFVLGISFYAEDLSNYIGANLIDESIQTEATEVEIEPLVTSEDIQDFVSKETTTSTEDFLKTIDSQQQTNETMETVIHNKNNETDSVNPFLATVEVENENKAPEVESEQEINPFLSLEETTVESEVAIEEAGNEEVFHSAAPEARETPIETINNIEPVKNEIQNAIEAFIEENPNTYDIMNSFYPDIQGDPLVEADTENMHAVTNIVELFEGEDTEAEAFTNTDTLFTGTIFNATKYPNESRAFSYRLILEDDSMIRINTQRDLRNISGKKVTIEIEGTRDDFVLKHVYYKANEKLAESGPEAVMLLTLLLALSGAWIIRKQA